MKWDSGQILVVNKQDISRFPCRTNGIYASPNASFSITQQVTEMKVTKLINQRMSLRSEIVGDDTSAQSKLANLVIMIDSGLTSGKVKG